jgi:HEAT repeat protein
VLAAPDRPYVQAAELLATRALGERRDPAVLPFALKIASDPKADKAVRDEMFGVVEGIGGLEAEKGLLGIISSDKEEIVRYRAFESELAARKADGIVPGLEAFPSSASYKKVDVDDLLVKLIEKIGQPARPALVQALGSRVPLARMTAVMALAQLGHAPDAAALQKLATDSSPVKGFPAGDTVGKEAAAAAVTVKKRS